MRIVDVAEMRQIEATVINDYGFDKDLIIENVGIRGADFIQECLLKNISYSEIIVLVGQGNNGADGLAIARCLKNLGHRVRAFLLFPDDPSTEELKKQISLAKAYGVKLSEVKDVEQLSLYFAQTQEKYFILDAILGTGIRLPLSQYLFDIINLANKQAHAMVAVDIPSGIHGDTGAVSSAAIHAHYTLAISYPKLGSYLSAGPTHSGEIVVLDVGFPAKLMKGGDKYLLTHEMGQEFLPERNPFFHKKQYGHLLAIGGSVGLTGALSLSSQAGMHAGAGLISAVTWESAYNELLTRLPPEIMTGKLPVRTEAESPNLFKELEKFNAIVVGPGLGRSPEAREIVLDVLNHFYGPVLIDADAIHALSLKDDSIALQLRKGLTLLTPHVGEFAHFMGISNEDVLYRPMECLKEAVDRTGCAILLKSSCSILALPTGEFFINYWPNDGLAKGGSGDVLAGMIGGLLAQSSQDKRAGRLYYENKKLHDAICLGLSLHSLAAQVSRETYGSRSMTAMDLINSIPEAFQLLEEHSDNEEE